jgi:large subunit ribosomal protein L17
MISLAKRGKENLHARRQAIAFLYDLDIVRKLFNEIGPKYASRNGGYTRVVKTRLRRGDAATMAVIQLV